MNVEQTLKSGLYISVCSFIGLYIYLMIGSFSNIERERVCVWSSALHISRTWEAAEIERIEE